MKISRLRLLGFKSFVEPTELVIEQGLTGVVGPNGCGKSNLLEALRWVMGETSHKSMRAAAMDDVIFSGTNSRPARNSAEVTIFLDNSERKAPAEFNGFDTIEITRRIEREAGSAYRINGREARARDIKILFEDAATGARSPALVRQGQIGEIVNAKPEQRRRILEDAAGIAGLHSRRHEAELRLKATETNLARLNDVLGQLNSQVESLKRQARAARRYKEISGDIRRQEALLFHLSWTEAQAHVDAEEAALRQTLATLGDATQAEAQALGEEARLADGMNPLREEEAKRAAIVARLRLEQETFEQEAQRAADRQRELEARAEQLSTDLAREEALITEAREILAGLEREVEALRTAEAGADAHEGAAKSTLAEAESALQSAEQHHAELTANAAERRAKRNSLEAGLAERRDTIAKLERQLAELDAQTREITGRAPDAEKLAQITQAGKRLGEEISRFEVQAIAAEEKAQTPRRDGQRCTRGKRGGAPGADLAPRRARDAGQAFDRRTRHRVSSHSRPAAGGDRLRGGPRRSPRRRPGGSRHRGGAGALAPGSGRPPRRRAALGRRPARGPRRGAAGARPSSAPDRHRRLA